MPFALYSDSDHYSLSDVISVLSANGMEVQGRELCLSGMSLLLPLSPSCFLIHLLLDGSETLTEFFFALTLALDSDGASSVSSLSDDSLQHIDSPTVNGMLSRQSSAYLLISLSQCLVIHGHTKLAISLLSLPPVSCYSAPLFSLTDSLQRKSTSCLLMATPTRRLR